MQLEAETSCVHHFKYVRSRRDAAPRKQHFCSDFLLFRALRDGPAPSARCSQWRLHISIPYCGSSKLPFLQIPTLIIARFVYYNRPSNVWLYPTTFLLILFYRVYIIMNGLFSTCPTMAHAVSDSATSIWWVSWGCRTFPRTVTEAQPAQERALPQNPITKAALTTHAVGGPRQGSRSHWRRENTAS